MKKPMKTHVKQSETGGIKGTKDTTQQSMDTNKDANRDRAVTWMETRQLASQQTERSTTQRKLSSTRWKHALRTDRRYARKVMANVLPRGRRKRRYTKA